MKSHSILPRVLSILIMGALMGVSIWFGSSVASTEEFHKKDIAYLAEKQNNAKALSGSASAASVLVSMLPEDTATPLANQIADIGRDFLIVLSALAAEQSLLTITGRVTFCWMIPIALCILVLFVLLRRKMFLQIGIRLAIAGIVVYMLVPVTLRITRLADKPYEEAVNQSLQQSQEIEDAFRYNESGIVMPGMSGTAVQGTASAGGNARETEDAAGSAALQTEAMTQPQTETKADAKTPAKSEDTVKISDKKPKRKKPWYEQAWNYITGGAATVVDEASKVTGKAVDAATAASRELSDKASKALDRVIEAGEQAKAMAEMVPQVPQKAADMLNSLIDAFVLMIVTTCVLPIAVLIGLLWVMNQIFNIDYDWRKLRL